MPINESLKDFLAKCSFDELVEIELILRKEKKKFGKKERHVFKASDPVIEFRLRCHRICKEWLCDNGHGSHAWDALQNKGLNGIIDKIKFALSKSGNDVTDEAVRNSFVGMMRSLPAFYANKTDFDLYDRRFNAIVSEIRIAQKNGAAKPLNPGQPEQPQFTDRFTEAAQRIAARHAGG